MTALDYGILVLYVAAVALAGVLFSGQKSLKEYFLGDRNIPWWAAGFSGIAISANSLLGGPGQAFKSDLTFLQYRLALPAALLVNCFVIIPAFYRLELYSVYEYLERRFDLKTRLFASGLFVLLKCLFLGIVIYAPALVVAQMTDLPLVAVVFGIGLLATGYTMLGGIKGVVWTDVMQMLLLLGGVLASIAVVLARVEGGAARVWEVARSEEKLRFINPSLSLTEEFTLLGGLVGGAFLMLTQNGVDQSEVQRFLTTSSLRRSQLAVASSMVMGALFGLLFFILGVALYVFYLQAPGKGGLSVPPDRVFPKFILEELPPGVTGLVIAGVFAAATSSISAVLNSLSTVTLSDFYSRLAGRSATTRQARLVTAVFGVLCTVLALYVNRLGTILVASSKLIGFFGGTLVGVFLLGMLVKRAHGRGAFLGAVTGFVGVILLSALTPVSWMWYGVFSAALSFGSGLLFSLLLAAPDAHATAFGVSASAGFLSTVTESPAEAGTTSARDSS
jgi:solute:Na+ symporter, SSS family